MDTQNPLSGKVNVPEQNSERSFRPKRQPKIKQVKDEMVEVYVWELPVRIWHWVNVFSIIILMVTGIFIGKPFAGASIPEEAYYSNLMGWVRYIHFFGAFLFTANSLVRLYWLIRGNKYNGINLFKAIFWKEFLQTIKFYLFMKNKKPHYVGHNPLAQLGYLIFIGLGSVIMILTGFFLYFEPQPESLFAGIFSWVAALFGGDSFSVRSWHHIVAWGFIIFMVFHVYFAWRDDYLERNGTLSSIGTGYKVVPKKVVGNQDEE